MIRVDLRRGHLVLEVGLDTLDTRTHRPLALFRMLKSLGLEKAARENQNEQTAKKTRYLQFLLSTTTDGMSGVGGRLNPGLTSRSYSVCASAGE